MDRQQKSTESAEILIEETKTLATIAPRPAGLLLVLAGFVHLLAPRLLLLLARLGYDLVLNVEFDPRANATRRVRLVGLGMVTAGGHLLYHGAFRPNKP